MAPSAKPILVHDEDDESVGASVLAHPILKEIPPPSLPLNEAGVEAYERWSRTLQASGALTEITREWVEMLAMAVHDLAVALKQKKSLRYPMEQKAKYLRKIEKLDVGHTPQAGGATENPYAHFGFAKRARQRRHG
ncbi:hypothetical protein [Mangrovibrevibacter kandeliae]|uniref:hypothetical protein n=1 Tax=Mangrovibrevibacter kandeliae TaxID=2968473 RepID=UPI0021193C51|nr:hypothetical protein [Aurantimonas sp. CSK15Z-1]MCQ8781710.1 hypothetical protein [Aurantimonas sp. CSK15Z-1]